MDGIAGIGVDSVEIRRVVKACERRHFLYRIFTEKEREQMDAKKRRAAADFAGKEAVVKMFGTGFSGIEANEVEILRRESGEPFVCLYGKAKERAEAMGLTKIWISLTDTQDVATAFVIGTRG